MRNVFFIFYPDSSKQVEKYEGTEKLSSEFFQILTLVLKLVNYSCSQKPINDDYLAQVDES